MTGFVFAADLSQGGALFSVGPTGGQPRQIMARPDALMAQPVLIDGDRSLMYFVTNEKQETRVCVSDTGGTERGCVALAALSIGYSQTGHLLFSRGQTLFAQRIDIQNVALIGDPVVLVNELAGLARQYWSISTIGSTTLLAYFPAAARPEVRFGWFDRTGASLGLIGEAAPHVGFDLSGDQRSIVASRVEADGLGVFVIDAARGVATRTAAPQRANGDVVWAPDARRFAKQSGSRIIEQPSFGGAERVVFEHPRLNGLEDWSRDGRHILVMVTEPDGSRTALAVPAARGTPIAAAKSTGLLDEMRFSPDGKWILYNCDDSGRHDVYVSPLPTTGERWPVSTAGGLQGRWRGDGRELYYLTLDGAVMAVDFGGGSPPQIGSPQRLFETDLQPAYNLDHVEVSEDGKRFLIKLPVQRGAQSMLNVIVNWTSLLPN